MAYFYLEAVNCKQFVMGYRNNILLIILVSAL